MRCLTILFAVMVASTGLGFLSWLLLGQPEVAGVFGWLTVAQGLVLAWLLLIPAVRRRYGPQGERTLTRILSAAAAAVVILPLLGLWIAGASAIGFDLTFLWVTAIVVAMLAAALGFVWWERVWLRRSWRQAAELLDLRFDQEGPCLSGTFRNRHVDLWLDSGSGSGGGTHTHLAMELRASPGLRLAAYRKGWTDRVLRRPLLQPSGDRDLDRAYAFRGDIGPFLALIRARPALREHLGRLAQSRLQDLTVDPHTITYTRRDPLGGSARVVGMFEAMGDIADLLEAGSGEGSGPAG
jgi:hypothetical protein